MPTNVIIGEFEQLVLLGLLRLGDTAYALPLRKELSRLAQRSISRGALYRTLDRLEQKGLLEWELEREIPKRGGHPRRRFRVTRRGLLTLAASRKVLLEMWSGLEKTLDETVQTS
jgi:DNA-binding PadR family transcriptional regulator